MIAIEPECKEKDGRDKKKSGRKLKPENEEPFLSDSEEDVFVAQRKASETPRRKKWSQQETLMFIDVMSEVVRGRGTLSAIGTGETFVEQWKKCRALIKHKSPNFYRKTNAYYRQWFRLVLRYKVETI